VTAKKLRAAGIEKLVQVRSADMELLRQTVGSLADWLRQLSFGDDPASRHARPGVEIFQHRKHLCRGPARSWQDAATSSIAWRARTPNGWCAASSRRAPSPSRCDIRWALSPSPAATRFRAPPPMRTSSRPGQRSAGAKTDAGQRPVRLLGVRVAGLVEQGAG
jgi:hypothetical protein